MLIQNIFTKDISRPINGVVKADQLNESVVWQELDEYVVTRELDRHLRTFLSSYLGGADNPNDPILAGRMAVWVSGFFGSGKSHFIKILSYLLGNRAAYSPDGSSEKKAVDFFSDKIKDPMLLGDIRRTAAIDADVILFNIDSRADATDGRSTILSVFWRLFNESQGFCSNSLPLAEIERYLSIKGKYEEFKTRFKEIYGSEWENERDAYSLFQDEIVEALSLVLDKNPDATRDWFEKYEESFNLTVEQFARRVKEYLDTRSKTHRIIFLVDEIGQFIGSDTHLMLNLQTIVEDLGRICGGRAWVLVTSQEDIDAVLGDIKSSKANDFSKIQGRFNTRLSLSSANTDEVIQARLLEKQDDAKIALKELFSQKGDILKNQLSFTHDTTTLKNFSSDQEFATNYPFTPYHFQLVQKIFESIRKAGATGLHLSRGERSMLDAFQSAAKNISSREIGALVPLYEFFPCIESFLDTSVKRSIEQARENRGLNAPFDINILQTLFLIRYVDIIKPNIDNLATLCIDQVDADRIILKEQIDGALVRLEKENLISRNGDLFFFLTNEEREVSREIKSVEISSHAETELLGDIVFDDILKNKSKHKYLPFKRDYVFNRICDEKPWGKKLEDELSLEIISPMHDEYSVYNAGKCIMHSLNDEGTVLIKMGNDQALFSEIRTYIQTDKYIKEKSDAAASTSLKQILRDRADDNRGRRERLISRVDDLILNADFYTLGKTLEISAAATSKALDQAFDYLVLNTFSKFNYLTHVHDDPIREIRQILLSDDIGQKQLLLEFAGEETQDIKELRTFVELKTASNKTIVLDELVKQFSKRPFGWPPFQIVILTAKLFMAGNISLFVDKARIGPKDAIPLLSKTNQWKNVQIVKKITMATRDLQAAKDLGKEIFGSLAPDGQEKIGQYIQLGLKKWTTPLYKYKTLADTGGYPGKREIDGCLKVAAAILDLHDAFEMIKEFNRRNADLLDAHEDFLDIQDFYENQKQTWETLQGALKRFLPNKYAIEKDAEAQKALKRMEEIVSARSPYQMLKDVSMLVSTVERFNDKHVDERRKSATDEIDNKIKQVSKLLNQKDADDAFKNKTLFPLQNFKKKIAAEQSIPQMSYSVNESQQAFEDALEAIDEEFAPVVTVPDKKNSKPLPPVKKITTIKPANFKHKAYLDTEEDVAVFIEKVKAELLDAIKDNFRIRVL
ncbi:MAG: BREX system P-loop protein BrxC [Desulfobacterium sp.]|nr:BREX system P-loop protein BrxC [Desulfobacterium sp.]